MTIEPVVVQPGDGLFTIASRLAPAGITQAERNQFAMAIAVANGGDFSMQLHPGRILWFDTGTVTGVRIENNRIRPGTYGPASIEKAQVVQSGNVNDTTGAPITL